MPLYVFALLLALTVFALIRLHQRRWHERLSVEMPYDEVFRFKLRDGGQIELRHLSAGEPSPKLVPVLLVHGIAVSHRNNDPLPHVSFARYLRESGRDVWLLTLRSGVRPRRLFSRRVRHFTAMRDLDLPFAVDYVLRTTGHRSLDLVGYSMGGMVLYAALGRTLPARAVHRALVMASPGLVPQLGPLAWARYLPRALTPTVPMRMMTRSFAFLHAHLPRFITSIFYNHVNVSREVAQLSMFNLFEDIPGELAADFVRWAGNGGTLTLDGSLVLDGLHGVEVPVCFFAGGADLLAPLRSVRAAFDAWGRDVPDCQKALVLFAESHGARHDYGHGDFALGKYVHHEVFAPALRFLDEGPSALRTVPQLFASSFGQVSEVA